MQKGVVVRKEEGLVADGGGKGLLVQWADLAMVQWAERGGEDAVG